MDLNVNINREVLSKLEVYLESLKNQWDSMYPNRSSWLSVKKTYIIDSTIFLVSVLDDLVVFVQKHVEKGSDKKAIVLSMSSNVFDYIVGQAFPVWLRPFAPAIKEIVVSIVISQLVEFIVKKYKEGSWSSAGNFNNNNPPDVVQSSIVYVSRKEING